MTKYIARPFVIEAEQVDKFKDGTAAFKDGMTTNVEREDQRIPEVGDYFVKDHGTTYFMSKEEFERKFIPEFKSGHSAGY